jgi:very-short-patch-repair endonuclease
MTFQVAIVLLIGLAVLFYIMRQKQGGSSIGQHLYRSKPLLSANEKEFFNRLSQALPDCHILTQVALGALLQPNVRNNNKEYYRARGNFSQKIADYVICNKEMYVLAVVELDDRTHQNDKDAKRDAMLEQAGYKVIRWDSKNKPTAEQIRERF